MLVQQRIMPQHVLFTVKQPIGNFNEDEGNENATKQSVLCEQKQSLRTLCMFCACALHVGTFLCRPLQNNNLK